MPDQLGYPPITLLPNETPSSTSYKCRNIARHLVANLTAWRAEGRTEPLMVGMQGPQGSGKTTIARALTELLQAEPYRLRVQVMSLDDLYLPRDGLLKVATENPSNALLQGRGLPGTHDLPLARSTLSRITRINDPSSASATFSSARPDIDLPVFDKSLFDGYGDRSSDVIGVSGPLDVFVLEGWCMGFQALEERELESRYEAAQRRWSVVDAYTEQDEAPPHFLRYPLASLLQVNSLLRSTSQAIYPPFTTFIQLALSSLTHIHRWRLEQERAMSLTNGGRGMDEDGVRAFVDRYLPGYELFGDGVRGGKWAEGWKGRGLGLVFGSEREVLRVERF